MAILLVTGFKNYVRLQYAMFAGTGILVLIMLVQFLRTSPAAFAVAINHFNGIVDKNPAYYTWLQHDVSSVKGGYNLFPKFALGATLLAAPIASTSAQWATYSVEQGGEIKGARVFKDQMFIIVGSLIAVGIVLALIAWTEQRAVGTGFFNAASASYYGGVSASGTGIGSVLPFPGMFAIIIFAQPDHHRPRGGELHAGLAADPLQLLHRHDPRHGRHVARPYPAGLVLEGQCALPHAGERHLIYFLLGCVAIWGYSYVTKWATLTLGVTFACGYVFVFSALAAALLPYRAKALYEAAPGAQYKFLGIPLVTIFGVIGAVFGAAAVVAFLVKKGYGLTGTSPVLTYAIVGGIIIFSVVIYWISRIYQRGRGIDISYASSRCRPSEAALALPAGSQGRRGRRAARPGARGPSPPPARAGRPLLFDSAGPAAQRSKRGRRSMTSATMTPDEVIAQIADWQGRQVSWEVLGGGITNLNYLVSVAGERDESPARYVLRIPGQGTDVFIDRERELANHVAAAASGVTPPLLHRIEPGPCTVVPFIDGETLHPTPSPAIPTISTRSCEPCAPTTTTPCSPTRSTSST